MLQLIFALLLWLFALSPVFAAQNGIHDESGSGIVLSFHASEGFVPVQQQLDKAAAIGIEILEFDDPRSFQRLNIMPFSIFLNTGLRFPVSYQMLLYKQQIISALESDYQLASSLFPGQIKALSLFTFPDEGNIHFREYAGSLADSLTTVTDVPVYFRSALPRPITLPENIRFASATISPHSYPDHVPAGAIHFKPSENKRESLQVLQRLFDDTFHDNTVLIILPARWFFNLLDEQPEYEIVFSSYIRGSGISFPLPEEEPRLPDVNWSVLFLFAIWATFVIHFKYHPIYAGALARYFFNHSFFVIDIMEHRIRNALPGFILLLQHTLLTGLFFYVAAEVLFSELGIQALSHHFPSLFFMEDELLSLFFTGVILAALLQFISVIWIHILNKKLNHISQTLNLYSWPLHINLVVVTLLVVLNLQASGEIWVLILAGIFALVWFLSFNIAAINGARFLERFRFINILLTIGLHSLFALFLIWLFLYTPQLIEPLQLAISMP